MWPPLSAIRGGGGNVVAMVMYIKDHNNYLAPSHVLIRCIPKGLGGAQTQCALAVERTLNLDIYHDHSDHSYDC